MPRPTSLAFNVVAALAVFGFALTRAACAQVGQYGQRNAHAPAQLDAFAFFIGKWEGGGKTRLATGKYAQFSGVTWIGRYILDGTAISDEFHASAPDGSPYLGISFRQFDAVNNAWVIEYLNVTNSLLRRQVNATSGAVKVDGPNVVVISNSPDTWSRETYHVTSHNHFTYSIDLSTDRGRSWTLGQIQMSFDRKE